MQKNLKKIAVSIMLVCLTLAMLACNIPSDNRAVISVDESLIPTGGLVGKEITLPAATATDVDGTDISESILLTVAGLRDGTEASWPIYRQPGNIERAFVPARYSSWKVTYSVIGSDGNTVTKDFYINLEMDTTKPVLTVASQEAITVGAGEQLVLPAATAIDDGSDIAESIKVKVYSQDNALLETYKTGGAEYAITLPSGTYTAVYACEDASGNAAEEISVALTVERLPYNTELMTEGAFKRGYASRFVNGELTVGFVSNETYDGTDCSSAAFKADKIGLNDIVGVSAVFDPVPAEGGENFYTMSYYASKSNDQLAPNGNESQWPQAFFIRVHDKTVSIFSYNGEAEAVADIALRDGAVHNIYMQTVALGAGAEAEDAAISFRVWIDALPTEAPTLSVTVDASHPYFDAKTLAEMWNGTPGWLSFGSYINNKNVYNDDVMTVKSIKLFKEDAQDFFAPLPVISLDGSFASIYEKDEAITLPVATFENTVESAIGVYDSEGNLVEAIDATTTTYAFTAAGEYTVRYTAKNADGIRLERKFNISVINDYSEFTLAWPTTIGVADGAYEDAFLISNAQSGNDQIGVQILNDSGDNNLVAAKITVQGFANGCWFGLQISGASNYTNWISGSGLCLNFGGGRLYYGIGGKETPNAVAVTDALFGEQSEYVRNSNGVNIFELCLVYRLNYVGSEAEGLKAIELEVWYGNSFEAMTKAVFHAIEGKVSLAKSGEVVENATKPTLTAKFIYDLGVSESTYGQGAGVYFVFAQGGQDWRTSKAGCDSVAVLENEPKIAPDFTVVKPASSVYFTNQAITLPEIVSGDNVASMRVYYEADGAEVEVEGNTVSFANAGSYTVFFEAVSDEGVTLCKKWSLTVMQKSETVDMPTNFTAEPTATVSESFQQTSGQAGAADATQITNGLGSGKYTYVTITQNDYSAGNLCVYGLQITGNTKVGAWFNNGKGLYVVLKDNNIYLSLNGRENENNLCVVENAISSSSKYVSGSTLQISLAIKANYLTQDGGLKVMQLEMWAKAATGVYEKLAWKGLTGLLTQEQVNELLSAEDPTVISFNAGILDNLAKQGYTEITEQGAGVVVAHAQGPAATITVSGVSVSTTEPQTEVIALEIPTVGEVSVLNTSGSKKAAQYGDDNNVQILSSSGNGQLVAMKLSMNPFNTNNPGFFGVQILGSNEMGSWMNASKGLVIYFGENNAFIGYNKETPLAVVYNIAGANSEFYNKETGEMSFYLAYQVDYVVDGENLAGVKVTVWMGKSLDSMSKLTWTKRNGTDEMVATAGEFYLSAGYILENEIAASVYSQGKVLVGYAQGGLDDGSTVVTVSEVQLLDAFPVATPKVEIPTVGEVSVSNTSGSKKAAQYGDDNNVQILSNSGNGQLVAMKLSMNPFNTNNPGFFGVQILGSNEMGSWMNASKGLVIYFGENNAFIGYNKETPLAVVYNIAGPNGEFYNKETGEMSFYLAYQVDYVVDGENLAGVKVTVWMGKSLDSMSKLTWTKRNGTDEMVATAGEFYLSAGYILENEIAASVYSQGKVLVGYAQGGLDDGSTVVTVSEVQLLEAFPVEE